MEGDWFPRDDPRYYRRDHTYSHPPPFRHGRHNMPSYPVRQPFDWNHFADAYHRHTTHLSHGSHPHYPPGSNTTWTPPPSNDATSKLRDKRPRDSSQKPPGSSATSDDTTTAKRWDKRPQDSPERPPAASNDATSKLRDKRPRDSSQKSPGSSATSDDTTTAKRWDKRPQDSPERPPAASNGSTRWDKRTRDGPRKPPASNDSLCGEYRPCDVSTQKTLASNNTTTVYQDRHPHSSTGSGSQGRIAHDHTGHQPRQEIQYLHPAQTEFLQNYRQRVPIRPTVNVSSCIHSKSAPITTISVITYNVLAQELISNNKHLYQYSPSEFLEWEYRKKQLLHELTYSTSNVLCLQEIQEEHYHSWFKPELSKQGFDGVYQRRTGSNLDGCAIFYSTQKFRLIEWKGIQYRREVKILDRDNVGIIVKLAVKNYPKSPAPVFCVANTHLLFNPKAGDVKLAQLSLLFAELHKMATVQGTDELLPCLLCGDLNSTPNCPLLELVEEAKLDYSFISALEVAGYFSDPRKSRRIPVPLLPANLNIGADCRYICTCTHQEAKKSSSTHPQSHSVPSSEMAKHPQLKSEEMSNHLSFSNSKMASEVVIDLTEDLPLPTMKKFSRWDVSTKDSVANHHGAMQGSHSSTNLAKQPATGSTNPSRACSDDIDEDCMIVAVDKHCPCECFACKVWPCLKISSNPVTRTAKLKPSVITHPFNFTSAYPHSRHSRPSTITTYHGSAFETVDYIYYTSSSKGSPQPCFHLLNRVGLPSTHTLLELGPQPHKHLSSDHLLLKATFQLL